MNMVGKIFVFLNMFLAVAFMVMAMFVYAQHRNLREEIEGPKGWKPQYIEQYQKAEALTKKRNELEAQLNAETIARERALAAAESHRKSLVDMVDNLKKTLVTKEKSLTDAGQQVADLQSNLKMHLESETKVADAAKQAADENDKRFKRLISITDELNTLLAQKPANDERLRQVSEQVAKAKVLLDKLGRTIDDPPGLEPPPVSGSVLRVSRLQEPNLLELSLGKDDGLRINHTVDIYRGTKYLGRAVITSVDGNRAVAKVMKDGLVAPVKEEDSFTTSLQYLTSQTSR